MNRFDTLIIGGGLSGFLHARSILKHQDPNHKLALVDPDPDSLGKKTFSSWRRKDLQGNPFSHLVTDHWEHFRIVGPKGELLHRRFDAYVYERIPGDRILSFLGQDTLLDPRLARFSASVERITSEIDESIAGRPLQVELDSGHKIFSNTILTSAAHYPRDSMIQYFLGLEIETDFDVFDPTSVVLMDFRVPQEGAVRFVYILPFGTRTALAEFTVFSRNRIPDSECEELLRSYLSSKLGLETFRVIRRESGDIPMSLEVEPRFAPAFLDSRVRTIGGAAGRVKPSTGYSFQRNCRALNSQKHPLFSFRFQVYDKILLGVLGQDGNLGAEIFYRLFSRNPENRVFAFLDEDSSLLDEIRIFMTLPLRPFLQQLFLQYPFVFATGATCLLHLLPGTGTIAVWLLPLAGLMTIGIGHGSIDHWMAPKSVRGSAFFLPYLGRIFLFLLFCILAPLLVLLVFILQSADHFGEAQWHRAIRYSKNHLAVRFLSWLWGLFASLFGVLFHWTESTQILSTLLRKPDLAGVLSTADARLASFILLVVAVFSAHTLDRYVTRSSGYRHAGVLSTLVLAASVTALPLLPGFLCFFVFWHSWDSVMFQRSRLGWSSTLYFRRAFLFTALSILGSLALMVTLQRWEIFFFLIGALTAAHAPVMSRFFRES